MKIYIKKVLAMKRMAEPNSTLLSSEKLLLLFTNLFAFPKKESVTCTPVLVLIKFIKKRPSGYVRETSTNMKSLIMSCKPISSEAASGLIRLEVLRVSCHQYFKEIKGEKVIERKMYYDVM